MKEFVKQLPKIELHAHISGCMRKSTFIDLYKQQYPLNANFDFLSKNNLEDCFTTFSKIHQLKLTQSNLRQIVREILEDFDSDNVQYLELRTTPKSGQDFNRTDCVDIIINEIKQFETQKNMLCRLILSIDRDKGLQDAYETINILNHFEQSKYLVGVDFSGNPRSKLQFRDYDEIIKRLMEMDQKISVHLGEVNNQETLEDTKYILKNGVNRVGHLCFYDDECLQILKQKNIPIELCFTSNICTLELKHAQCHHYQDLINNGIKIIPCTDDTLCFNTSSTKEMIALSEAFNLSMSSLIQFQHDAINSTFDESIRSVLLNRLQNFKPINAQIF